MKTKNNKNLWLYGALAFFIIAIVGAILVLFVFKDKKSHTYDDDEDDEDDTEVVEKQHHDWDDDEWDNDDEKDDDKDMTERETKNSLEDLDDIDNIPSEEDLTPERPTDTGDDIHDLVEQQPRFNDEDINVWLGQNINYPVEAQNNGVHGTVVCQFIVEKDGSISNVTVLRSVDPLLDKEAVRVLESMPNWTPGRNNGQPVRVKYTIPVSFKLQ